MTRTVLFGIALLAGGVAPWLSGCDPDKANGDTETESTPPNVDEPVVLPSASASAGPAYEREDLPKPDHVAETLADQREVMLDRMQGMGVATAAQADAIRAIMEKSRILGQGNPQAVQHPMTRRECLERRAKAEVKDEVQPRCGAPFMVPIYDPDQGTAEEASVCIDRYEFPNLPCDYPVTWVTTGEAQALCKTLGKRLCDAHEWEGACAGRLLDPEADYRFGPDRNTRRGLHNIKREIRWAYGPKKNHSLCATNSHRSKNCATSGWRGCGSNTYPAGAFPTCRSPFGVYDQHGNAAEHMLLPAVPAELGTNGGTGVPEMKGSWFIFAHFEAHIDDCRWRAPSWHDNEGMRHANYHLGFRCCRDVE